MDYNNKSIELLGIAFDKQRLLFLSSIYDMQEACKHIQEIEMKYFDSMMYFSLLYPKPYFITEQINWCTYFLDMLFSFKIFEMNFISRSFL